MGMLELLEKSIEVDPNRCGGRPVLKGTRFTISQLLSQLADGDSVQDLVDNLDLDGDVIRDFLNGASLGYESALDMHEQEARRYRYLRSLFDKWRAARPYCNLGVGWFSGATEAQRADYGITPVAEVGESIDEAIDKAIEAELTTRPDPG